MTMHRAKGTEFSDVLLFGVGASSLPNPSVLNGLSESDRDDALLRERSLLYVAATRARDQLACTWSGARSPLLPQMKEPA
jgi:superfamily I DNA/RNA helicase